MAAFAIHMFRQDLVKQFEAKQAGPALVSNFLGKEGDKLTATVFVNRHIQFEGAYGITHLYLMKDKNGNEIKWFSSRHVLDEGCSYEITGRIKGHDVYKGVKATILTRAKGKELIAGGA